MYKGGKGSNAQKGAGGFMVVDVIREVEVAKLAKSTSPFPATGSELTQKGLARGGAGDWARHGAVRALIRQFEEIPTC
jgi:hypothetical protein